MMMRIILLMLLTLLVSSCASTPQQSDEEVTFQQFWPRLPEMPRFRFVMNFLSSDDFVVKSEETRLREAIVGRGRPAYIMVRPLALASSKGMVYLIDGQQPVINVFDLARKRYFKFGYRLEGKLVRPVGIAIDKRGFVYVTDRGRNSVIVYDSVGLYQAHYQLTGVATQLAGIAVDDRSGSIYVVDRGGLDSDQHRVIKLSAGGEVVGKFGRRGSGEGEFNLPLDIAVAADGQLYVLDSGNFRVQVLSAEGEFRQAWGRAGNGLGQFAQPRSIAIGPAGNVYVGDTQFGNIQIFTPDGDLLLPIGRLSQQRLPGHYSLLSGIAIDEKGYLYVLDQYQAKMEVFQSLTTEQGQKLIDEYIAQQQTEAAAGAVSSPGARP